MNKLRNCVFAAGEDAQFTCVIQSAPRPKIRYTHAHYLFLNHLISYWVNLKPCLVSAYLLFKVVQGQQVADWPGKVSDLQRASQWSSGPGDKEPDREGLGTLWVWGWLTIKTFFVTMDCKNNVKTHTFSPVVQPSGQCQVWCWSNFTVCCGSRWWAGHHNRR